MTRLAKNAAMTAILDSSRDSDALDDSMSEFSCKLVRIREWLVVMSAHVMHRQHLWIQFIKELLELYS
jgi:hypothetical protein